MNVSGIDAVYYTVKDVDALSAFYTDLLGAAPAMTWPGRLAEWTLGDGNSFGLYGGAESEIGVGSSGSVMFAVPDVAAAVAAAKGRGVKFSDNGEVTDTPACHMAFGEDPEGNQFILHHRKAE